MCAHRFTIVFSFPFINITFVYYGTLVCAAGAITHISIPDTVIEIGKYVFEDISPDARFTVATEAVKQLLKDSESGIKDEQITVKDVN